MTGAPTEPAVRAGRAVPLAVLLGVLVAAHSLLETARDSLFLSGQPVARLPWLYLAVIAVVLPVTQLQSAIGRRRDGSGTLVATLVASAVLTLGFWATAKDVSGVNALYVWAGLFSSMAFVQFWLIAAEHFEVSEAKRVFGFIAAGGLVGAVAGTGAARLLLFLSPPRTLLVLSAALMIAAALLSLTVAVPSTPRAPEDSEVAVMRAMPHQLRTEPYFRLLGLLALLPALAALLIDFLFKASISAHIGPEAIPAAVANVSLTQSGVALVMELIAARLLFRSVGVTRSLLVLPLVLLVTGAGVLVVGGLLPALGLRILDAGLRPSLNRVGTELLYLPVSPARRRLLKPSLDALGQRGGQALGSFLILGLLPLGRVGGWVTGALMLVTLGWLWVVRRLRPLYLQRFREQLGSGRAPEHLPELDLATAEVLVAALGSPDSRQVLTALELLARGGRAGLIPALILYHPDPAVVRGALDRLGGQRADVAAMLPSLLRHSDSGVRALAVRRWFASGRTPDGVQALVEDPDPRVKAAALVAWSAFPDNRKALEAMEAMASNGGPDERRELAREIAESPRLALRPIMKALFTSGDTATRREVLRAAQHLPFPATLLPVLVRSLEEEELREPARAALVAMGPPALHHLGELLLDPATPYRVDRELPAAVASFAPGDAAPLLLRRIGLPRGGVSRFRSLRALNRIRQADPSLELEQLGLEKALEIELSHALGNRTIRLRALALGTSEGPSADAGALLIEVLQSKETLAIERAFRVLQLLFPGERLERVYLGARSQTAGVRGAAQEVLVELLPAHWSEPVLSLLSEDPPPPSTSAGPEERRDVVLALLASTSVIVRLLTARIASDNGCAEAVPALRAAAEQAHGEDREVLLAALGQLESAVEQAHG